MFYDPYKFIFAEILENNFQTILEEYHKVSKYFKPYFETHLHNGGWDSVVLYAWPNGSPVESIINICPNLNKLVKEHIPKHKAVGFNRLRPGTKIFPHKGIKSNFLRYHLGLVVPEGECFIKVLKEKKYWQLNKSLVFNDQNPHYVENNTDQERVILLIDFEV